MQLKVIDIVYMSEISFTTREICWFLFKSEDYINISVKLQEAHFADFQIKFDNILNITKLLQKFEGYMIIYSHDLMQNSGIAELCSCVK